MDNLNVTVRRAKVEALLDCLNQFATEKSEQAKALYAKGGDVNEHMANWYEGRADAYGLVAKWIKRDILGLNV